MESLSVPDILLGFLSYFTHPHSPWIEWITIFVLIVCAVTDVMLRRTSELLIVLAVAAICVVDFSWWHLICAALLALPWMVGVFKGEAGLGDVEMAFLLGFGFCIKGFFVMMIGVLLALITRRAWPSLSTRYTPSDERQLAPIGFYFTIATIGIWALQKTI